MCNMLKSVKLLSLAIILSFEYVSGEFFYHDSAVYDKSSCRTIDKRRGICQTNCTTLTEAQKRENICSFVESEPLHCCPRILLDGTNLYPLIEQACSDRNETLELRAKIEYNLVVNGYYTSLNRAKIKWGLLLSYYNACLEYSIGVGGDDGKYFREWCDFFLDLYANLAPAAAFTSAKPGEHQHMAVLGWTQPDMSIQWNCGGTLIHSEFVLTAAHCMFNLGTPPDIARINEISLIGGSHQYLSDYDIVGVFSHENYVENSNDIAVLKVKRKKEFLKKRAPIQACLWTKPEYPSNRLLMMGFGAAGFGREYTNRLFQAYLEVVDQNKCVKTYSDRSIRIEKTQFCAIDPKGLEDTCEGDSGGPLQFNADDKWRTPYLVGIISFGVFCVDGNPGVYTKVYEYLGWIEKILRENQ